MRADARLETVLNIEASASVGSVLLEQDGFPNDNDSGVDVSQISKHQVTDYQVERSDKSPDMDIMDPIAKVSYHNSTTGRDFGISYFTGVNTWPESEVSDDIIEFTPHSGSYITKGADQELGIPDIREFDELNPQNALIRTALIMDVLEQVEARFDTLPEQVEVKHGISRNSVIHDILPGILKNSTGFYVTAFDAFDYVSLHGKTRFVALVSDEDNIVNVPVVLGVGENVITLVEKVRRALQLNGKPSDTIRDLCESTACNYSGNVTYGTALSILRDKYCKPCMERITKVSRFIPGGDLNPTT